MLSKLMADTWKRANNPWFGVETDMTSFAIDVHLEIVEEVESTQIAKPIMICLMKKCVARNFQIILKMLLRNQKLKIQAKSWMIQTIH